MTMPMGATGARSGNKMTGNKMSGDKIPKGFNMGQLQQFTPEQMQLFQQMLSNVGPSSYLSRLAGGEQGMFDELEAPAMKQFSELQGGLASRFSGMGMGGRRSSGFQNTSNQATSDFAQQLQSQRLGIRNQAIQDLMGMSSNLLQQRPTDRFVTEKPMPFWKQLLLGINNAGSQAAGSMAGMAAGKAMIG